MSTKTKDCSLERRLKTDSRCISPSVPVWTGNATTASKSVADPPPVDMSGAGKGDVLISGELSGVNGPGPKDDRIEVFQSAERQHTRLSTLLWKTVTHPEHQVR